MKLVEKALLQIRLNGPINERNHENSKDKVFWGYVVQGADQILYSRDFLPKDVDHRCPMIARMVPFCQSVNLIN